MIFQINWKLIKFVFIRMPNRIKVMNFNDTFLNMDHLLSSFPNHQIVLHENDPDKMLPPYRLVRTLTSFFFIY